MAVSSTTTQPIEVQKTDNANNSAAAPRKRRRRAPATGATEDCFSCKKRQVKCDRRRPYCGQCVEIGKECSGYRTTLTWGVGVASRGKLRGMTLPIAKSASTTATQEPKQTRTNSIASASTISSVSTQDQTNFNRQGSIDFGAHSPRSPASPALYSAPQEYQYFGPTSPIPIPSPSTPLGFPSHQQHGERFDFLHPYPSKMRMQSHQRGPLARDPLHRIHTSLHPQFDESALSASAVSLGTYSDSDFPSPSEFPHTPVEEYPFADPTIPRYSSFGSHEQAHVSSYEQFFFNEAPRSLPIADDMSSSVSSDQSVHDFPEVSAAQQSMSSASFPDIFVEGEMSSSFSGFQPGFSFLPAEGMSSYGSGPLSLDVMSLTTSIPQNLTTASPLSPRMLSLLDYYDKFICPVLVAFDGQKNPYRMHIIHLAMRNPELQNGIAALATNNMRMRGGIEGRRLSVRHNHRLIPDHAYSKMTTQELREMHGQPSAEEQHYKKQSIALLNKKLVDIKGSQDDSVLATLLILCLFHVCDSGFTKFKTQLAGVQKLLSLRDRNVRSEFVGWIETFFTWFDVMTATVNDREIEVRGDSLDMMNLGTNLGALEHHSGCEGRLFKLIARLGRLNLLSQNRPVRDNDDTPTSSPRPKKVKDFYSFSFANTDGNGWGSPIYERQPPFSPIHEDGRATFWTEWRDVRTRLQQWEFRSPNGARPDASMSPAQAALVHISESFRYAALLYTERLAHPTLPAGALNLQRLVSRGLYHISRVGITSCVNKFLLWPLFILGTECVEAEHRAMIRQRCIEIQRESGFFNNVSGLEVLERVWREDDEWAASDRQGPRPNGPFGGMQHPFRWRRAMDRVDGEYIVL